MTDPHLDFLEKFLCLYRELVLHDGYGDIEINISLIKKDKKEIRLHCGREYQFRVPVPSAGDRLERYRMVKDPVDVPVYAGPERRSGIDRRDYTLPRRCRNLPRNFKLERRRIPDRRSGRGRRLDD